MTRDILLNSICPMSRVYDCCNSDTNFHCVDCTRVMNEWLDEYDKQIRAEAINDYYNELNEKINTDTRLKETIREIHDNVAREMYCKGVDDMCTEISSYFTYGHCGNIINVFEVAEKLKEQNK